MTPVISVIIPFYNMEEYLDRCLTSVRDQSLSNIEIICIDDCSRDGSYSIVSKHVSKDSRISLIRHDENIGVGGARNTAINIAKADSLAFVDSDDFIQEDMLEKLWNASENGKHDVVCCGFNGIDTEGKTLAEIKYEPREISNIDDSLNIFSVCNPAVWNKLWKKDLFISNNIYFPSDQYFEDMSTQPRLLSKAKQIKIIADCLYHYSARRADSITNSFSAKHINDLFKGFEIILSFLEENNLVQHYSDNFNDYIDAGILNHVKKVTQSTMNDKELVSYLRHLLVLKTTFIESRDFLESKNPGELQALIARK